MHRRPSWPTLSPPINRKQTVFRAFTDVIAPVGLRVKADAFDVRLYITE